MSGTDIHDHHDHSHAPAPDRDGPWTDCQYLETAIRELLVEKNILTAAEIHEQVTRMDSRTPARGAEVVAKAWTDPDFKQRLLRDGSAAVSEVVGPIDPVRLIVVENSAKTHNVVVCTLCSCYPRNLLGLPPDWYKQRAYRSRVVREPRQVLAEFGTELADDVVIRVHDSTADMRYMILPARPEGSENLSAAELASCVTRDDMIGVTVPRI